MALNSTYCWIQPPKLTLSPNQSSFSHHPISPPFWLRIKSWQLQDGGLVSRNHSNAYPMLGLKRAFKDSSHASSRRGVTVYASNSNRDEKLNSYKDVTGVHLSKVPGVEPFSGKSGSVSFHGLTHQLVEESKLMSAPFNESTGSFLWVLAPAALISSLLFPQFFVGFAIEAYVKDVILADILASLSSEIMFYMGLGIYLLVAHRVQKPYLEFSAKRWGLITGLRGYLASAFFATGFKVMAPLFAVYVTWPLLGLPALVSVAPFLIGCVAQLSIEKYLEKCNSSCWPLVPIIFEVYRVYQLTRAAYFIEKLMFSMNGVPVTPEIMERSGALFAMIVTFQILGVVCLWSLLTFLLRLFPSRPVKERY